MSSEQFWNKKSFVIITGASRGFGRSLAIEFSKKIRPNSTFLLLARDQGKLEDTKSEIEKLTPSLKVITASVDLAKPTKEEYFSIIHGAVNSSSEGNNNSASFFEHAILVHNAGTTGNLKLSLEEQDSVEELQQVFNVNIISMIVLTSVFLRLFNKPEQQQRSVIQITSVAGAIPFIGLGAYGMGKAGRDMAMKSLAAENPSLRTLSYTPGPLDTEMYMEVQTESVFEDCRKMFEQVRDAGIVSSPEMSATRLVQILDKGDFENGDVLDFDGSVLSKGSSSYAT